MLQEFALQKLLTQVDFSMALHLTRIYLLGIPQILLIWNLCLVETIHSTKI